MERQERLEKAIIGENVDRVPALLWRFWQGDDQRSADLAKASIQFQSVYDWDAIVVPPAPHGMVTGYGLQDVWHGAITGERHILKSPIQRSLDWTELRSLDPLRGDINKYIEALRLVVGSPERAGVPVVAVVFSPFTQALQLGSIEGVLRHLRTQPDRLKSGLNTLTESTLRLIEQLGRLNLDGLFYVAQGASLDVLSETEYETFGLPYDAKVAQSLPKKWWFKAVSLGGEIPMLKLFNTLPFNLLNWQMSPHSPTLQDGKLWTSGAVMGGLSKSEHLHEGTPLSIKDAVRHANNLTHSRRFVLSCGGAFYVTTPLSNLQAVRDSVKVTVL